MENINQTIIEAGHYYECKGPTAWSTQGVAIMEKIRRNGAKSMLFVDDLHPLENVSIIERFEDTVYFDFKPDYLVMESEMIKPAQKILEQLLSLNSKKKRASRNPKDGKCYISGFPITKDDGETPLCVLLDAALTVHKRELGFDNVINILPYFYQEQQSNLLRILNKLNLEELTFSVLLFKKDGEFKQMNGYEHTNMSIKPISIVSETSTSY